jgi:hypothetical protein
MKRVLLYGMGLLMFLNCVRGVPSDKPPIQIIRDMNDQPRYDPQSESRFFADSASMRQPVPGTVSRGNLKEDSAYYFGRDSQGNYIQVSPAHITLVLLKRGQERFNIYCSPCHSRLGDGKGIVVQRGYLPPPSFHADRIRQFPDGEFFDVISNGVRNMPSYGAQIKVADRWAIVSYIRALQLSQNALLKDIPAEMRGSIK